MTDNLSTEQRIQSRVAKNSPISFIKADSVKLYRAKAVDEKFGAIIPEDNPISDIPHDLDSLEVPNSDVQLALETEGASVVEFMKLQSSRNRLNWQRTINPQYRTDLGAYIVALREFLSKKNGTLFVDNIEEQIDTIDITEFSTIEGISVDLQFGNEARISISVEELRLREGLKEGREIIPRENDVLEIVFRYPNGKSVTTFIGQVSAISFREQYGKVTSVDIIAFGMSKILMTNKMVVDRAIVQQFENGELSDAGIVVWSKLFAFNTADEIFNSIMINQLALTPETDSQLIEQNDGFRNAQLLAEKNTIERNLVRRAQEEAANFRNKLKEKKLEGLVNKFNANEIIPPSAPDKNDGKTQIEVLTEQIRNFETEEISGNYNAVVNEIRRKVRKTVGISGISDSDDQETAQQLTSRLILIRKLTQRLEQINKNRERFLARLETNPLEIKIDYKFDPDAFKKKELFQFAHIPLTNLAAVRLLRGDTVAKFRGKRSFAFEQTIRSGFELFFSQVGAPAEIMDAIRTTAKHIVYENEQNQIVAEIPRYNDFSADEEESIEDFIITNPINMDVIRQDIDLITRLDTKAYFQLVGQQPFTLLAGYYTDPAVLSRYGMRTQPPSYNPNARTRELASLFSAVETADRNARTRTIEMTVAADRDYKVGRLYFIARKPAELEVGGPPRGVEKGSKFVIESNSELESMDGYVGFLSNYAPNIVYGGKISHQLTFTYVRKAALLFETKEGKFKPGGKIAANFRILPDIGGVIDAVTKAAKNAQFDPNNLQNKDIPSAKNPQALIDQTPDPFGNTYFAFPVSNASSISAIVAKDESATTKAVPFEPTRVNGDTVLPVVQVESINGGINQGMVQTIHLMDIRLRALNEALFRPFFSSDFRFYRAKKNVFKALFLPNERVNGEYRIANFRNGSTGNAFRMYILQPIKNSRPDEAIDAKAIREVSGLGTKFRIVSKPIDLRSSYSFAMLRADGEDTFRINGNVIPMFRGNVFREDGKSRTNRQIDNISEIPIDVRSTIKAEFEDAAKRATSIPEEVMLPVIFVGPIASDTVIDNTEPGLTMTMLDLAQFVNLPGSNVTIQSNISNEKEKHSNMTAIDMSLVPWYGATGYVLKDTPQPYILSRDYDPRTGGHPHGNASSLSASQKVFITSGQTKENLEFSRSVTGSQANLNLFDVKLTLKKKDEPQIKASSDAAIKAALNAQLAAAGAGFEFNVDDLPQNDRFWYHLEATDF